MPAGHSVHAEFPALAAIQPGSQTVQLVEPLVENLPAPQARHVPAADEGL